MAGERLRKGGRLPHIIHRWNEEDRKIGEYEEKYGLRPITPPLCPPQSQTPNQIIHKTPDKKDSER